jgi:hypothetical protein
MNIRDLANKAAHPYHPPLESKSDEKWLERFAQLVREECFEECARIAEGSFSRDGIRQSELTAEAIRGMK